MNVAIAVCKCSEKKKLYGIRFEKDNIYWRYTWAFPINENTAKREKFDKTKITGSIVRGEEYPGCPFCGTQGFFLCSCGKLNCLKGQAMVVRCNWCGQSGILSGGIVSIDTTSNM